MLGSIVLYVRPGVYVHFGESLPNLGNWHSEADPYWGNCRPNMEIYG
nr:MAG TPA: hypothetical protein [Caudoviricetes sp.]DAH41085.1 MAG TPA: hypothetical protein [Caudoviricetes sp.]